MLDAARNAHTYIHTGTSVTVTKAGVLFLLLQAHGSRTRRYTDAKVGVNFELKRATVKCRVFENIVGHHHDVRVVAAHPRSTRSIDLGPAN